ncbi:MAG TPA: phosphoribosylanthranilate isomerase [Longimicrobiales bacterium]|nr:phosphoribosylanthranilate isomerase [Longimicrobiales bacterium]
MKSGIDGSPHGGPDCFADDLAARTVPVMVEVKICGVCRAEDARAAASAGADWVGVILAPGRTRTQTVGQAAVIFDAAEARRVGVFVDAAPAVVVAAARALALDAVQLHGDEPVDIVRRIRDAVGCEVWKALRVRDAAHYVHGAGTYGREVDALVLDGWSPGAHGGAGVSFDWSAVAAEDVSSGARLVVAGGLTPANVAAAVALLRPAIVDVSSGVEEVPGRKSHAEIHAFIAAARGVRIRDDG